MTTHAHGPVPVGPKANQHFLQFNRWETTNKLDFSEPSTRPPRRLLPLEPPVQVKVQKRDTKFGIYESEAHSALEAPQRIIRELKALKRQRATDKLNPLTGQVIKKNTKPRPKEAKSTKLW